MNLNDLYVLVERLRKEAIGEPEWIAEKKVFEYRERSAKVVAILKLARAAHGVTALNVLCHSGLFIDFGAIIRCVNDCTDEIYFLLEEYPRSSSNVDKFVESFFASTIDEDLSDSPPPVQTSKIRSATIRVLKGRHDDATQKLMERMYRTFCGYIHANYAHIMEVYNGRTHDFNLGGVPAAAQKEKQMPYIGLMENSVLLAAAFIAQTLDMKELSDDILAALD